MIKTPHNTEDHVAAELASCSEEKRIIDTKKTSLTQFPATVFCVILGVVIRLLYCIRYPVQPRDAYIYGALISQWEETGTITDQIGFFPLSIWFMKIPAHFFQYNAIKGGVIINILLGIAMIIISINVFSHFFKNRYTPFFIGLIVATHPILVRYSCSCLRENSYLLFSLLALASLANYYRRIRFIDMLFACFFGVLSFLCRVEGLELFALYYVILLLLLLFKQVKILKAFSHGFAFFVFFFLFATIIYYFLNKPTIDTSNIISKF